MSDAARTVQRLTRIADQLENDAAHHQRRAEEVLEMARRARNWAEAVMQEVIQQELGEL